MDLRAIIMGVSFALIWSSAFTSARIIVQAAPPISISCIRFFIAGLCAVIVAYLMGQRAQFSVRQWRAISIFGLCQNAIYLGLFFVAMQTLQASIASIIASTMPLLVALFSAVFFKERLALFAWGGLLAGFIGVLIIMVNRIDIGVDYTGLALCVIGVVALAIATLTVRSASNANNLLMVVGLQMLVGSAVLFVPAILLETWDVDWSPKVIVAFIYTIIAPGIIATYIWFALVNRIGATKAATFHFLNPFFGVAIAALILSENLSTLDVIGVIIIMLGILAVQISAMQKRA